MGNKGKKLFYVMLLGTLFLWLLGCSVTGKKNPDEKQASTEAPVYGRSTLQFQLSEDANPYMMECTKEGFYYFAMRVSEAEESADGEEEPQIEYQFFYQTYDGKDAIPFCVVENGIVRDFSGVTKDEENQLVILLNGDEACILEFDQSGDNCRKVVIDERFNNIEDFSKFLACPDGGFVIAMKNQVFFLDADGQITETLKIEGEVRKFFVAGENELFAVIEKNEAGSNGLCLAKLNIQKQRVEVIRDLESDLMGLYAFEDGVVSVYGDRVVFFHVDREDEEVLIDLNKQSLLASEIQFIFGNRDEIKIVSMNEGHEGYLFALKESIALEGGDNSKEPEEQLYATDGRRILRVAVPQGYPFQIEFHVKKYNQTSDKVLVKVERFEGSLEDFLGKGNRPDIIMFNDHTEIPAYVEKNALVDLIPLFNEQEKYSLDGIVLIARELLGIENTDAMYGMAGKFWLMLRTSDGTEYDSNGKCDAISYLKWYDKYMTENEISGVGRLENLLYANVGTFYDENMAAAFFTSDEFKELMQTYKYVYDRHKGDIDQWIVTSAKKFWTARGPWWYLGYGQDQLAHPDVKMEGIPGTDGENHVYIKLDHPMSIMSTSECKEEAFDFIMYYSSHADLLIVGYPENFYGETTSTSGYFSVDEEIMNEQIYETEKPYCSSGTGIEYCFTDEQKTHLRDMINSAVSTSKTQGDIYAMLMEEMDAYLKGGKDLDSACDILQNRAELYLKEKK